MKNHIRKTFLTALVITFALGYIAGSVSTGSTKAQEIGLSESSAPSPDIDYKIVMQNIHSDHDLLTRTTTVASRAKAVIDLRLQGWQNWAAELEILRGCIQGGQRHLIAEQVNTMETMPYITPGPPARTKE